MQSLFLILWRPRPHVCKAYSLSWTAIIISIDGFSVPPSISFPNYTVERSAVANNQINEFGYLDSIIAPPSFCNIHNNPLFGNMSTDWQREHSAPRGDPFCSAQTRLTLLWPGGGGAQTGGGLKSTRELKLIIKAPTVSRLSVSPCSLHM